jgi:Rieske Fe-S protein
VLKRTKAGSSTYIKTTPGDNKRGGSLGEDFAREVHPARHHAWSWRGLRLAGRLRRGCQQFQRRWKIRGDAGANGKAGGGGSGDGKSGGGNAGGGSKKASGGGTRPGGAAIASESEVAPGSAFTFEDAGNPAVLVHLGNGDFVAYSAVCTHQRCEVAYQGGNLACPCHGSVFDPANGAEVVAGPAPRPLPEIPVKVEGGEVLKA